MGLMTGYTEKPKEYFSRVCRANGVELIAFEKRGGYGHAAVKEKDGLTRYYYFSASYHGEDGWGYGSTWSEEHNTCDDIPSKVLSKLSPVSELYPLLSDDEKCNLDKNRSGSERNNQAVFERKLNERDVLTFDRPLIYGGEEVSQFIVVDPKRRIASPRFSTPGIKPGDKDMFYWSADKYRLPRDWRTVKPKVQTYEQWQASAYPGVAR